MKSFSCPKLYPDDVMKQKEGDWFDEKDLHMIIREDCDVYSYDGDSKKLLFKFRKNVIDPELCNLGFTHYKNMAKPSRSRGASAGPINTEGVYWSKRQLADTKKWRTKYMNGDTKSKMMVNNPVVSGALGYYEASPNFHLPCRMTNYTTTSLKRFQGGLPFIERIDELYKELLPEEHSDQHARCKETTDFQLNDTAFSTITMNRNFRTALHKDKGDYGFGNLAVLEYGHYSGGYTCFPQYGVGFDLRQGDFVVMDVHQFHCNTPLYETDNDKEKNESLENIYKRDNPEIGTAGICKKYARLSFVCYLREKMIHCKNVKKQTEI